MTTVTIFLNTVEKVKGFVNTVSPLDGDFDLVSDRYVVDAKSIMGIFSLDLSKPLTLQIHSNEERILPLLKSFIVE
ncbi:MAG: HPr family phosphocarrier protein [Firmicutes bacterium]|nr:HPr family phosphocarrier protein [Bacillota bacterium]